MEIAKVTSKGQITIPVAIRNKLSIKEGDKIMFIENSDGVLIVSANAMTPEKVNAIMSKKK